MYPASLNQWGKKAFIDYDKSASSLTNVNKSGTDNSPLNVLYINGMDEEHTDSKKNVRNSLDEKSKNIHSGEINVKNLEGDSAKEKMDSLKKLLNQLHEEKKLDDNTQVIMSFKPGEKNNTFDISRDGVTGYWKVKQILEAVRGEDINSDGHTIRKFNGTIHLFGFESKDFGADALKNDGNLLLHSSGKFNWDYKHDEMINLIASNAKTIEGDDPENRTRAMRDVLQDHAGYPVVRAGKNRVTIKYPTFSLEGRKNIYEQRIARHKDPVGMFISSIQRDSFEKMKARMDGGLLTKVTAELKNKKFSDNNDNLRLLTALASATTDVSKKLDYFDSLGISISRFDMDTYAQKKLSIILDKRSKSMDPLVYQRLLNLVPKEKISDDSLSNFLISKVTNGSGPEIDSALKKTSVKGKIQKFDGLQILDLLSKILSNANIDDKKDVINRLIDAGMDLEKMNDAQRRALVQFIMTSNDEVFVLYDFFESKGLKLSAVMTDLQKLEYKLMSDIPGARESIRKELTEFISDSKNYQWVESFARRAFTAATRADNPNLEILKFLLDCGLNPNFEISKSVHLLHGACGSKNTTPALIKLLLEKKADVGITDGEYKMTPLHCLALNSDLDGKVAVEISDILMDAGADITAVFDKNQSAIHCAAYASSEDLFKSLLVLYPGIDQRLARSILERILSRAQDDAKKIDPNLFKKMLSLLFKHKPDLNVDDNVDFSFSEYMKTIHGFEKVKLADLKSELLGVNNQALKV